MSGYEDLRSEYLAVYPTYERLAARLGDLLRARLDAAGLRIVEVSARAKEPDSFVKKALRKGYADPMQAIGDKAGVRLILPFARDRERVVRTCEEVLELSDPDDKREVLGSERIGYLGLHYSAQLRLQAVGESEADLAGLTAELQIHTKAESAWATAAHDSLYKAVVDVPDEVARRLYRLAALAEIFDDQIEQFLVELHELPDFAVLDAILPTLDRRLLRFTNRAGDRGLSALLVPRLAALYDEPPPRIVPERITPFLDSHEGAISELYRRHEGDARANPLLYQPEGLMLLERLDLDPYRLLGVWPAVVDVEPLRRLAVLLGKRLR
ncbi:MAG: pyrophosphokinae [Solirubrobacteraceae bacterium]|nr:pyrophosphokinae [Solirubrobacteraceae bacterium]